MYNNYDNDNFNNNPKPLFTNDFSNVEIDNNVVNNQNNFVNPSQDIPPVLEPIKNLSDATIVNVPTLDVLDPMNIMPESFENKEPSKVDPLDAYDNRINYDSKVNLPINNGFSSTSHNIDEVQNIVNTIEHSSVSTGIPSVENNFATNIVSFDTPNMQKDVEIRTTNLETPNLGTFDNNIFNPLTPDTNELNKIDVSTQGNEEKNEFNIKPIVNENIINNFDVDSTIDFDSDEEKNSEEPLIENNSYEIIQEKIEKENSMLNLGIDNVYDDIDMLDIVDIDEENKEYSNDIEEQKNIEEEKETEEKPLILDNINEIKELIRKIKEKGIHIELEEFDFEHMYQLIVKIEK